MPPPRDALQIKAMKNFMLMGVWFQLNQALHCIFSRLIMLFVLNKEYYIVVELLCHSLESVKTPS